jgi:hypothetical protein
MSGGGGNAQKQAQKNEDARQAAIANTQAQVNATFNSPQREADIQDYMGGLRSFYGQDLDKQKADTDRQLKFALARSGQVGGSTQVDQQKRFGEDYNKALLGVEQKVQGAGANLRSEDQDARARLISLATSGLDATTGAQQAAASMRNNLAADKSTNMAQGIGDMFGEYSKYFQQSRDAAVRRRADSQVTGLYAPPPTMSYGG